MARGLEKGKKLKTVGAMFYFKYCKQYVVDYELLFERY